MKLPMLFIFIGENVDQFIGPFGPLRRFFGRSTDHVRVVEHVTADRMDLLKMPTKSCFLSWTTCFLVFNTYNVELEACLGGYQSYSGGLKRFKEMNCLRIKGLKLLMSTPDKAVWSSNELSASQTIPNFSIRSNLLLIETMKLDIFPVTSSSRV